MSLNESDVILGIYNPENDFVLDQINYIVLHAKFYIHKSKTTKHLDFLSFLIELKSQINIKNDIAKQQQRIKTFQKIWSILYNQLN